MRGKKFRSICLKEFRYALGVPYITLIWLDNHFLGNSKNEKTKSKVKERISNIVPSSLFLLSLLFVFINGNFFIVIFTELVFFFG